MSLEDNYYSDLKIGVIRGYASDWVRAFPCIDKISLYAAGNSTKAGSPLKYVIVVKEAYTYKFYKNEEGQPCFCLKYNQIYIEGYKELFNKEIKILREENHYGLRSFLAYHDWASGAGDCEHISDSIPEFYKDISKFYSVYPFEEAFYKDKDGDELLKGPKHHPIDEWFWWPIGPGEEESELNEKEIPNDFVITASRIPIYPIIEEPVVQSHVLNGNDGARIEYKSDMPEERFVELLWLICPDILKFYERLPLVCDRYEQTAMKNGKVLTFRDCAEEVFDEIHTELKFLKIKHFGSIFSGERPDPNKLQRIKSKLAQSMIKNIDSKLSPFVKSYQEIESKVNSICKKLSEV